MKLIKISADEKYASIGESEKEAEWYTIEPHVERFIKSIPPGTEVGIKSEKKNNKNHLVFITKSNGTGKTYSKEPRDTSTGPLPAMPAPKKTPVSPYGNKSPEVQESIKRQAIGHMTSRSLIALQGQVTIDNIEETITRLYKHYQTQVG